MSHDQLTADEADRYAEAFNSAVARVLRETRKRKGLSRHDVSFRSPEPLPPTSIASYELGHRAIKLEVFVQLCRALGEPPARVLAEAEHTLKPGEEPGSLDLSDEIVLEIDVPALLRSTRAELAPLRRWAAVRTEAETTRASSRLRVDRAALTALAELLDLEPVACLVALAPFSGRR